MNPEQVEAQTLQMPILKDAPTSATTITYNEKNPAIKICHLNFDFSQAKDNVNHKLDHIPSTKTFQDFKQTKMVESKQGLNDNDPSNSTTMPPFDFAGPSNAVKDLFALPYSNDIGVAVAVHNVGNGTILLDGAVTHDLKDYETFSFTASGNIDTAANAAATSRSSATWKNIKHRKRCRPLDFRNPKDYLNRNDSSLLTTSTTTTPGTHQSLALFTQESSLLMGIDPLIVQRQLMLLQRNNDSQNSSHINMEHMQQQGDDPNRWVHDISHILPEADEYTSHITDPQLPSHGIAPLTYLDWKFKGYNLMVQSNSIILSNENTTPTSDPDLDHPKEQVPTHSSPPPHHHHPSSNLLTLRVAHAERLRLALEQHESQNKDIKKDPRGRHLDCHRPTMSYAEAVGTKTSQILPAKKSDSNSVLNSLSTHSLRNEGSFPDFSRISLSSCALPSTDLESKLQGYGYSTNGETTIGTSTPNHHYEGLGPSSSPVCMILDAYLDNIMANVPQLALCLQDGDLIQGIKVLPTTKLPYLCSSDISYFSSESPMVAKEASDFSSKVKEPLFNPIMVENNAHMILDFIKSNCIKENQTYLLRRNAGETSIQLIDVTVLSKQRQQKWVHWLAMMSLRFAAQLKNLSMAQSDPGLCREYRQKRRNLLENSLQLLFELADIAGTRNEVICSSIYEQLADTYLTEDDDVHTNACNSTSFSVFKCSFLQPTDNQRTQQPYSKLNINSLLKAQDLLSSAVKELHLKKASIGKSATKNDALCIQLYGLYNKQMSIGLANTRHYLQRYQSSNVMQSLRQVSRIISSASDLLLHACGATNNKCLENVVLGHNKEDFIKSLSFHVANLWEECGNFARSFASDGLWRDQGHCAGEDICSLLQDVELSLSTVAHVIETPEYMFMTEDDIKDSLSVTTKSKGVISMQYLTGVVPLSDNLVLSDANLFGLDQANAYLQKQKLITREKRRVLVGASVCYGRAADIFMRSSGFQKKSALMNIPGDSLLSLMLKRLGDGCNEVGKALQEEALKTIQVKGHAVVTKDLLLSSTWWFRHALDAFQLCKDKIGRANTALMLCNLASCAKIRASHESVFVKAVSPVNNSSKDLLNEAIHHLEWAHRVLEERESCDPGVWDMVSTELALTYLLVGSRRRDAFFEKQHQGVVDSFLTPKIEKSITDPLLKALQIYSALNDQRKMATTNLHLAQYYSKIWMSQKSEALTKEKLSNAFAHYQKAHQYFFSHTRGNEFALACLIFELISLYKTVSPEKALLSCIDCQHAFSQDSVNHMRSEFTYHHWLVQMKEMAIKLEDEILTLVQILSKAEKSNSNGDSGSDFYKKLYRNVLTIKLTTQKEIFDDRMGRFRLSLILEDVKMAFATKK